jgi:hypothetical protein
VVNMLSRTHGSTIQRGFYETGTATVGRRLLNYRYELKLYDQSMGWIVGAQNAPGAGRRCAMRFDFTCTTPWAIYEVSGINPYFYTRR